MNRYVKSLSQQLFDFDQAETAGARLHFRLVEVFLVAYTTWFVWTWGHYIQQNIRTVVLPAGIAHYVDISFMFDHFVALGNAALITGLLLLGFFRRWRPAYGIALLLFHLQYVSRFCLGKIPHGANLVGMGILMLGLAHLLYRTGPNRRRFTFGSLYFFIGLGYVSAAVCKLIGTGLTWPSGQHLLLWITKREVVMLSTFGAFEPNLLQELVLQHYHWGTLLLLFGLVVEGMSFLIWIRRYRYYVVLLVVSMHVGIALTMNIFFAPTTYLLLLLGVPWGRVFDWANEHVPLLRPSRSPASTAR